MVQGERTQRRERGFVMQFGAITPPVQLATDRSLRPSFATWSILSQIGQDKRYYDENVAVLRSVPRYAGASPLEPEGA